MKKVSLILSVVVMAAMMVSSCGGDDSVEPNETNEGINETNEVTIGTQVWMSENLDVDKFRNGDPIPEAKTDEEWEKAGENREPAWCYYDNDPTNGAKYGKLYNWYAVNDSRGLAPIGWHVPRDEEWSRLTDFLGREIEAGKKMKSISGWGDGTNASGFSGFPAGTRNTNGTFGGRDTNGYWWSSSADARSCGLNRGRGDVLRFRSNKALGYSVRCLKD